MPIPRFADLRADIDEKLEVILHKVLERDRNKRYQSASDLLTDLELYLYSDHYGPTNEKLGVYLRELFDQPEPSGAVLTSEPSPVV
jgi:serine/threonine-protein kinase